MNYPKLIEEFRMITSASGDAAERLLQKANWNIEAAVSMYFDQDDQPVIIQQPTTPKPKLPSQPSGLDQSSVLILEHTFVNGCRVQVRHGDMTEEVVDAIVNAANGRLDHASGLAGAISKKGGEMVQLESDIYFSEHGALQEGEIVVLGAHELKCKHVIHAVGPTWNGGNQGEPLLLEMCVKACLVKANEMGMKSISLPAISTGIFRFPKPVCAAIMFQCVIDWVSEKNDSNLKEIRFTNFDDETVFIFKSEFEKRFKKNVITLD